MAIDSTTVLVLLILFASALVRSVFGFGHSLIAMPLLAMTTIGMKTATPLVALIALLLSLTIFYKDWRIIDFKATWRLLLSSLPGIPLGLVLLKGPYEDGGKIILALVIMGFSLYNLLRPKLYLLKSEWTAYPFGFVSGILGGAYNSNGPPIVIYGALRRWPPERFRANLQGYFFPSTVVIIFSHAMGGLWTQTVGWYFLLFLPLVPLSLWIANRLICKIPQGHFDRYIHLLLLLVGALLFFKTLAG
jgi:hypothetical protein